MITLTPDEAAEHLVEAREQLDAARRSHLPAQLGSMAATALLMALEHLGERARRAEALHAEAKREAAEYLQRWKTGDAVLLNERDAARHAAKTLGADLDDARAKLGEAQALLLDQEHAMERFHQEALAAERERDELLGVLARLQSSSQNHKPSTLLTNALAALDQEARTLDTPCSACGHPRGEHAATFGNGPPAGRCLIGNGGVHCPCEAYLDPSPPPATTEGP